MLSTLLHGPDDRCVGYFAQLPKASPSNPSFRSQIAQILHAHGHGRMGAEVGGGRRRCLARRNLPRLWSYRMLPVLQQPTAPPHTVYPPVSALLAPEKSRQRGREKGVERRHSGPASGAVLSAREQATSYVAQWVQKVTSDRSSASQQRRCTLSGRQSEGLLRDSPRSLESVAAQASPDCAGAREAIGAISAFKMPTQEY